MIERANRTLKMALKCTEVPTEWHNNLPWALSALRNLSTVDLKNCLSNYLVFEDKLRLPGEFFVPNAGDKSTSLHAFVNSLTKRVASFRYNPPRKANKSSYLDTALLNPQVTLVYVQNKVRRHSLQPAYKRSVPNCRSQSKVFYIRFYDTLRPHFHRQIETRNF